MRHLSVWMAATLTACLAWTGEVHAWSAAGHETVGAIADRLIADTPAAGQVGAILGTDLRTASVWADCAKNVSLQEGQFVYTVDARYRECRPFEDAAGEARMVDFVRRNWDACHPAAGAEPCHKQYHYTDVAIERGRYARGEVGTSDHDIVAATGAAIRVLEGHPAPPPFSIKDKKEALLLLAHLVGDIHQPLHVGAVYLNASGQLVDPDRGAFDPATGTRGGNLLRDGRRVLHTEWDGVPNDLRPDEFGVRGAAEARNVPLTRGSLAGWPTRWASETLEVAHAAFRDVSFEAPDGAEHSWSMIVPADYAERREALQRRQLVLAGARLAQVLEKIFH